MNRNAEPLQITAVRVVKAAAVKDHHAAIDYLTGPRLRLNFSLSSSRTGRWTKAFGEQQVTNLQGKEAEAFQLLLECENYLNLVDLDVEHISAEFGSIVTFPNEVVIVHAPFANRSASGLIAAVSRDEALESLLSDTTGSLLSRKPYRDCENINWVLLRGAACLCRSDLQRGWGRLTNKFGREEFFGLVVTSFAELGTRTFALRG